MDIPFKDLHGLGELFLELAKNRDTIPDSMIFRFNNVVRDLLRESRVIGCESGITDAGRVLRVTVYDHVPDGSTFKVWRDNENTCLIVQDIIGCE